MSYFKLAQGNVKYYITRFQKNGAADPSFTIQRVDYEANDFQLQSDGREKIIIADSTGSLARLKSNGETDDSFKTRTSISPTEKIRVQSIKVLKDDKIIVAAGGNIYLLSSDGMVEKQGKLP